MSRRIGIDAINLKATPRLAHTEYCDHDPLVRKVQADTGRSFADAWDYDLVWLTDDGPVSWGAVGRVTDMGHAEFAEGGVDRREAKPCPFTDPEQVLAFDAVEEYGLVDFDELVAYCDASHRRSLAAFPGQVVPGGYYKTLVSGAIESFGWEMLLAAAADRDGFERVLDSFFRLTLHHVKAWAKTPIEVFICHDDMVWSEGPFVHPDFYRKAIFPRYAALWKVLRDAGKKVLFCSDAKWTMFVDDIAAAGADGFIFEPMTSLDEVVAKYGRTHVIVGSKVDCRTLAFKGIDEIRAEIDATLELAFNCPGFFCAVGNHIPANVPIENAEFYIKYLQEHWRR